MKTQIIAHRGSKGTHPENTLAAFREALRVKSDGIELDVHLSVDSELIVIHDETTKRTTGAVGVVAELTLAQLKELDAGSWFDPRFAMCKIPTLREVLELLDEMKFTGILNIELKTDKTAYFGIVEKVYGLIQEKQRNYSVVYSSFNYTTLCEVKQQDSKNQIALLFNEKKRNFALLDNQYAVDAWHPRFDWVYLRLLIGLPKLPIRVWTVNGKYEIRYFIRKKVAGIITDFPEMALKIREDWQ